MKAMTLKKQLSRDAKKKAYLTADSCSRTSTRRKDAPTVAKSADETPHAVWSLNQVDFKSLTFRPLFKLCS